MPKSTIVKKPRPDFPLFPHATGRWAKKVRGRFVYFGKVQDDPAGSTALNQWLDQRDDLLAGRKPRKPGESLTVVSLCNHFLTAKRQLIDTRELTVRSWGEYYGTCASLITQFGKGRTVDDLRANDFLDLRKFLASRNGPVRLGNEIQRVRSVFKWAFESELIDKPIRTGPDFCKPAKRVIRKARQKQSPRMFEASELRAMIEGASTPLKAMIFLGLNCGLGNNDCGSLVESNLNLETAWLDFPRPKTGVSRCCWLWPETITALRDVLAKRPPAANPEDTCRVFLTEKAKPWTADALLKENGGVGPRVDSVTQSFRRLLNQLKLHRHGLGFYTLRHVFETIAGDSKDQVAVDCIMGHADQSMAAAYRERIGDDRLIAVAQHVRKWLFGET